MQLDKKFLCWYKSIHERTPVVVKEKDETMLATDFALYVRGVFLYANVYFFIS